MRLTLNSRYPTLVDSELIKLVQLVGEIMEYVASDSMMFSSI